MDTLFIALSLLIQSKMIPKLLILGLLLAVSLDACLGRQKLDVKAMKEFADAIVQGRHIHT